MVRNDQRNLDPQLIEQTVDGEDGRFAFNTSNMVSMRSRSTPHQQRPAGFPVGSDEVVKSDTAIARIIDIR